MKRINQVVKYGAGASLMSLAVAANAAVPADVTTAIDSIGVDGATVAWAVLIGLVAIVAIKYIRKAL